LKKIDEAEGKPLISSLNTVFIIKPAVKRHSYGRSNASPISNTNISADPGIFHLKKTQPIFSFSVFSSRRKLYLLIVIKLLRKNW
jgi:hypothetical protein